MVHSTLKERKMQKLIRGLGFITRSPYFIVSLVTLGIIGTVITNACISIALVAMTSDQEDQNKTVIGSCPVTESIEDVDLNPKNDTTETAGDSTRLRDKVYDWSQATQSTIFGAVFIAYIIVLSTAGQLVQRFGGRWFLAGCLFGSCFIDAIIPFSTDYLVLFIGLRLCLGVIHSAAFPAGYDIITKWVPPEKRSVCFAFLDVGVNLAIITSLTTSGPILNAYGWPGIFWMPSIFAGISCMLVALGIRNKPSSRNESEHELSEMGESKAKLEELNQATVSKKRASTPFKAILTNRAVLAAALIRFSDGWGFNIAASKIPAYLNDIQHEDISSNGFINAGMSVLSAISMILSGYFSDFIINKGWMSRTRTRKTFGLLTGLFVSIPMMCIPLVGCSTSNLHVILFLMSFASGFSTGCDSSLPAEITSNYAAVTFAIISTVGASTGFIAPAVAGLILDNIENQWTAWSVVFYSSGIFMILSSTIFQFIGSAETQPFDSIGENDKSKNSIPHIDLQSLRRFSVNYPLPFYPTQEIIFRSAL